ncbi:MAG: hypothetical protein Ct9H300mP28_20460 [Pseudomonadota bacterium]|nr:MAG: hypothetical protein Ct9H300mP28_20460 [Pseudomonadota bacterium]
MRIFLNYPSENGFSTICRTTDPLNSDTTLTASPILVKHTIGVINFLFKYLN